MKAAILKCDEVLEVFRPPFTDYSDMIQDMFAAVDDSIEFDIFDCRAGQYPDQPDAYDFFITTGSRAGAYEDLPWVKPLIEFIKQLDRKKIKLIGICFGHQVIAEALGGKVEKSDKGWGVGIASNSIVNTPAWMVPAKTELNILVSHQDQVIQLPEQAQVIARTDFCPNFFIQWSEHFISVQGHPEWQPEYSKALMNYRKNIIPHDTIEAAMQTLQTPADNRLFTQWMLNFITMDKPSS
jgi:GMP synthase-like glutamine amidotransferase